MGARSKRHKGTLQFGYVLKPEGHRDAEAREASFFQSGARLGGEGWWGGGREPADLLGGQKVPREKTMAVP